MDTFSRKSIQKLKTEGEGQRRIINISEKTQKITKEEKPSFGELE